MPDTTINKNDLGEGPDPTQGLGTIFMCNTGLKPWQGDNYNVTLEYYTDAGGFFGAILSAGIKGSF